MRPRDFAIVVIATAGAACTMPMADEPMGPIGAAVAEAEIREPAGRTVARSTATQLGDSVQVRIQAAGLAAGSYGAHVHAMGRCDAPGFESAGPHWNPTNRGHGRNNPDGQHLGDLPNLIVGTNGSGEIEFTIQRASLSGGQIRMLDADGAALVIHANADDYRTDPSGNSGARIACGVFR